MGNIWLKLNQHNVQAMKITRLHKVCKRFIELFGNSCYPFDLKSATYCTTNNKKNQNRL